MFKARNVIEAGILAFAIGVPVFSLLPLGLTARIIALCLTALPAALVALIGVSGESLSSFLLIFIKYLRNRRIVGGNSAEDAVPATEHGGKHIKKKAHKPDKAPRRSRRSGREDFPAEFDEVRSYEIRQKLRPVKKQKPAKEKKAARQKKKVSKERKVKRPIRTQEPKPACLNPVADYLPISKIENGIIYTKDHRYVKVVEVVPINFMLRSAQEQRNIIYSFVSYLKISPIKLQIKVLTRRAEINRHLNTVRKEMEQETNEQCLLMQEDYPDNYEVLSTDAALRAEKIACRLRHLIYSSTTIRKGDYLTSAGIVHGIEVVYEDGVLEVTLPGLLPKRKQRQNTEFLLDPFYFSLEQYAKEHPMPHFSDCVVCFTQVYDQCLPTRRIRDYDNLEEKQLLDVLSTFVMADDTGLLCDAYNTAALGEKDCTRISVMEKKRFPAWLAEHENTLKSISDF